MKSRMRGIPFLTRKENKMYARLRMLAIRGGKFENGNGGDSTMEEGADQRCFAKTLCINAMALTLQDAIPIENSRAVARHGNNYVRLLENKLDKKIFESLEKRRRQARKRMKKLRNEE